jgi:GTP pyrophosphokinase
MEVYWSHEAPAAAHEVNLVVETEDRTGMVAEITQIVADAKAPLRHIHADVHRRGYGVVYLTIQVKDKAHLTQIQSRLGRIQGVLGLKRVAR